jgi:hypothetical protein
MESDSPAPGSGISFEVDIESHRAPRIWATVTELDAQNNSGPLAANLFSGGSSSLREVTSAFFRLVPSMRGLQKRS